VTLKADLSRPGYIVLLDRYDSNWRACLDGREVPVLRANQIFRAVYAEPGQHVVSFSYRQNGLLIGILITCVTIVGLLLLYLRNPPFAPQGQTESSRSCPSAEGRPETLKMGR
jgi:uncharacterized membrane protein YfhO